MKVTQSMSDIYATNIVFCLYLRASSVYYLRISSLLFSEVLKLSILLTLSRRSRCCLTNINIIQQQSMKSLSYTKKCTVVSVLPHSTTQTDIV